MRMFLAVLLVIACVDDDRADEGADSEKREYSYRLEVSYEKSSNQGDKIMKGGTFRVSARIRFDDNEDQTSYETAHYKDDDKNFLDNLRNNDANPAYRRVSLTLDSKVKEAKLSGSTTGKTDTDGRVVFDGLKIDKAGRHKVIAKTTINDQDLSAKTHVIEINTPLEVQLSKIRGLSVGEGFEVTISREYPSFETATIDMVNFDGLMMWDGGSLSELANWRTTTVFKELFFYKPLPAGTREMLVKVMNGEPHDQQIVALPELGEQIGNVDIVSYDQEELVVNNLRGRTPCAGNCQVDAFTIRGNIDFQASAVTDTNGGATLDVECNNNPDYGELAIVVKVSQNNENFYFLFPEQDCN